MQKIIIAITLLFFCGSYNAFSGPGTIMWIDVGVNGLTCSMCTRSVEMSIRKLDFVKDVEMSLEKAEGRIYLRPDFPLNLIDITKAVVNAGFSVQFVTVLFDLKGVVIDIDGQFTYKGQKFHWINYDRSNRTDVALKLVDEKFLPKGDYEKIKQRFSHQLSKDKTTYHALAIN